MCIRDRAIIEPHFINNLPTVINKINIKSVSEVGITPKDQREEQSSIEIKGKNIYIKVGDSRRGWVDSYKYLLEASSNENLEKWCDRIINTLVPNKTKSLIVNAFYPVNPFVKCYYLTNSFSMKTAKNISFLKVL